MKKTTLNPSYFRVINTPKFVSINIIMLLAILFSACANEDIETANLQQVKTKSKNDKHIVIPHTPEEEEDNIALSQDSLGKVIPDSEIILVEGGSFLMGSPQGIGKSNEHPQHKVTLSCFKITKYEITNQQFAQFLTDQGNQADKYGKWFQGKDIEQNGKKFTPRKGLEKRPVVRVTWSGAKAFAMWVGGRLPTEAEWEYAAKGGVKSSGYKFSGSNDLGEVGWYIDNSGGRMHDVGEKRPNELGIYDMSGNVWEYTGDYYYRKYTNEAQKDPQQSSGVQYLRRGASAYCPASACRSANRSTNTENTRHNMGFRVAFPVKVKTCIRC